MNDFFVILLKSKYKYRKRFRDIKRFRRIRIHRTYTIKAPFKVLQVKPRIRYITIDYIKYINDS